jgi:hypothetical protein
MGVVVRRNDRYETTVKGNDNGGWTSDGVILWLERRQNGDAGGWWGRVANIEMIFLYQWRVRVGQSGEGSLRWCCGFNASASIRGEATGQSVARKMNRRQRAHLGSMGRKRDMMRQCDDVGRRRGRSEEGKGRRRRHLGWPGFYWTKK